MESRIKLASSRGGSRTIAATIIVALVALVAMLFLYANRPAEDTIMPGELRLGILPDQSPDVLQRRYTPVLEYLSNALGVPVRLVIPDSYAQLLELFRANEIDLAYFGGYSYVKARQEAGAIPLVMRQVDIRFTSLFIVGAASEARNLEDLRGKRIGFGSQLSTSGHLMPRYFLRQRGIDTETFFGEIAYSGAHDKTAYWVRDGVVDVGAANATTIRSMLRDQRLDAGTVRILWETPPYANYVWAIRPIFDEPLRAGIRDAFLALSPEVDEHKLILRELNASGYIPADPDNFAGLETIVFANDATLSND